MTLPLFSALSTEMLVEPKGKGSTTRNIATLGNIK